MPYYSYNSSFYLGLKSINQGKSKIILTNSILQLNDDAKSLSKLQGSRLKLKTNSTISQYCGFGDGQVYFLWQDDMV